MTVFGVNTRTNPQAMRGGHRVGKAGLDTSNPLAGSFQRAGARLVRALTAGDAAAQAAAADKRSGNLIANMYEAVGRAPNKVEGRMEYLKWRQKAYRINQSTGREMELAFTNPHKIIDDGVGGTVRINMFTGARTSVEEEDPELNANQIEYQALSDGLVRFKLESPGTAKLLDGAARLLSTVGITSTHFETSSILDAMEHFVDNSARLAKNIRIKAREFAIETGDTEATGKFSAGRQKAAGEQIETMMQEMLYTLINLPSLRDGLTKQVISSEMGERILRESARDMFKHLQGDIGVILGLNTGEIRTALNDTIRLAKVGFEEIRTRKQTTIDETAKKVQNLVDIRKNGYYLSLPSEFQDLAELSKLLEHLESVSDAWRKAAGRVKKGMGTPSDRSITSTVQMMGYSTAAAKTALKTVFEEKYDNKNADAIRMVNSLDLAYAALGRNNLLYEEVEAIYKRYSELASSMPNTRTEPEYATFADIGYFTKDASTRILDQLVVSFENMRQRLEDSRDLSKRSQKDRNPTTPAKDIKEENRLLLKQMHMIFDLIENPRRKNPSRGYGD